MRYERQPIKLLKGDNFKEHPKFTPREGMPTRNWWRTYKIHRTMAQVLEAERIDREATERFQEWKRKQDRDRYERERRGQRV